MLPPRCTLAEVSNCSIAGWKPPIAMLWAVPPMTMPLPPLAIGRMMNQLVPTAVSVICTPEALPAISMPLPTLPPISDVRMMFQVRWSLGSKAGFVEVIRMPFLPFATAPPNATMPTKLFHDSTPLAVSRISMPFPLLPEITLPSGITPPSVTPCESPDTSRPLPPFGTGVLLLRPRPMKLA